MSFQVSLLSLPLETSDNYYKVKIYQSVLEGKILTEVLTKGEA